MDFGRRTYATRPFCLLAWHVIGPSAETLQRASFVCVESASRAEVLFYPRKRLELLTGQPLVDDTSKNALKCQAYNEMKKNHECERSRRAIARPPGSSRVIPPVKGGLQ